MSRQSKTIVLTKEGDRTKKSKTTIDSPAKLRQSKTMSYTMMKQRKEEQD